MLVDMCQDSAGATCTSYVKDGIDGHNQTQIVQTYYDDFSLTGFNVRENRGTDYAIVYEDPAVDQRSMSTLLSFRCHSAWTPRS